MKIIYGLIVTLCAAFCSLAANASTATTTFQVTATVNNACTVSANNLAFGTYNPLLGTATDLTGGIIVTCTLGSPFNIGLNAGTASGATVTTRKMLSGANTLNYALYRDVAYTQNWGNTVGTDTLSSTGTGLAVTYPVYGVLPASQSVPSGSYADTVTVTVTY
jgi:spore coat protein U-like protein